MDDVLNRQIPHSPRAEQAVIGSMLIDPRCIPAVIGKIKYDDFYLEMNRNIFETITSMLTFGETIDPVTVLDGMRSRGLYTEKCDSYMAEVMRLTPTAGNVMQYVRIVADNSLLRRLSTVAEEIGNSVYAGDGQADLVLDNAERKLYALRQNRNVGGLVHIRTVVDNVYDELEEMDGKSIPGVPTGLTDLDSKVLGLNKGDFFIIAARPAVGKTSIALNMALNVAKQPEKKSVAIFSLEMTREQLVKRLISMSSLVDGKKLLTGRLDSEDWRKISNAAIELNSTNIYIDDNSNLSVADMNASCRRMNNLGLVVIDYLQLMTTAGGNTGRSNENRQQAVSDISRTLKLMAKDLNVPVLCLSQLSRATEQRAEKRPMLSDLRESGAIEQDADVVVGLYKPADQPNQIELIILKNRKGETGSIVLSWDPAHTKFADSTDRSEDG